MPYFMAISLTLAREFFLNAQLCTAGLVISIRDEGMVATLRLCLIRWRQTTFCATRAEDLVDQSVHG